MESSGKDKEEEEVKFGTSLIVPSVQELAKQHIPQIPPRYIRSDEDDYSSALDPTINSKIPVIDIQSLLSSTKSMADSELDRLHSASKHWGFFQVVNHGVSTSLIEKVKLEMKELFELPFSEKQNLWQQPGDEEGFGQLFVHSNEQKLDWSDIFYINTLPMRTRNSNLFAKLPSSFRETLEEYSQEIKKLALTILREMGKALKVDHEKEMREKFSDGVQSIRLCYYPTCSQPDQVLGFTPHSDADALTIVLQVNETEGLQIRKDGKWIPVKTVPNAFLVNIGDIMEIISNGVYRSIEHRAVVNSTRERLSIVTFYSTNLDAELVPALGLTDPPHNPPLFRRVTTEEYFKGYFAKKLEGKSYINSFRVD